MALNLSYSLADQDFHHTKSLGVWNVSTQLLQHLATHSQTGRVTVFSNRHQAGLSVPPNVNLIPYDRASAGRMGRILWDQWGVYSAAQQAGHPWLFLPKGFAPIFRHSPVRLAAYVHDTMHDYYQRNYPNDPDRNPLARETGYFSRSLRATLREAEVLFTNTEFTKNEIIRISAEWGVRVPPIVRAGVGFNSIQQNPLGKRDRIVVLVGPWPHKCTPLAIERLGQWASARGFDGGVDWVGALPSRTRLPERAGWLHHQRLSPEVYDQVLGRARILVYFSGYEGFGMPPVEGTLAGAAAVYSAIPAMSEVMGECGFRFANESYEQFAAAMDSAMVLSPAQLEAWQATLRARHNWSVVAERITETLSALESEPRRRMAESSTLTLGKKVLVFAHTPPPHHGQSYMIQQMLLGFGGNQRNPQTAKATRHGIACYHVNARLSRHMEDIGEARVGKLFGLFVFCLEALWCRFRHGIGTFYYVPAPGKQAALVRDWMVMGLCRPFFREIILHWHAAGLPAWLETHSNRLVRNVSFRLLGQASQSISLTNYNLPDALKLSPLNAVIVPNGIPDPCPDFETSLLPQRLARLTARQQLATHGPIASARPSVEVASLVRVLFLGHCTRQKGLFDTMEGVRLAQRRLEASGSPFQLKLAVCGNFLNEAEEAEFQQLKDTADFRPLVEYHGFVTGAAKDQAFRSADLFCFPTFYYAESFGLVVAEAMAYGLPVVTTRWRAIPEVLPPDYAGLVEPNQPEQIAARLVDFITHSNPRALREHFVAHFTIEQHLAALARAIHTAGKSGTPN